MQWCDEIVRTSHYAKHDNGTTTVNVNGVFICQHANGDVDVNCRPRHMHFSPTKCILRVRTHFVDMAVQVRARPLVVNMGPSILVFQEDDKFYVKRGVKRVHVSRSGLVVSDGNCITSMDHFGRIVSST
jgi:hypothetical protein